MKNMSKITCYCGQDGDQKLNMLQCAKCKHWFHEDCVKCLDMPMLYGDRFYIFICSLCNAGSECLARLEMKWGEIVQLLLYNLTIEHKKKYFDLDASVVPFLRDNWDRFQIFGPIANEKIPDLRSKVLQVLQSFKIFKSGKEIKKSKNIWGLREKTPPEAPVVQPSAARIQNDVVVWDFHVKERTYQVLTTKKSLTNKDACKNGKSKTKTSVTAPSRPKNNEVSKCRGSVPHSENGILKAKHRTQRTSCMSFNEDSARLGLLDSLIPFPPDFKHRNNPFQKSSKTNIARRLHHQVNKTQIKHTKRRHEENSFIEPIQNGNHNLINSIRTSYFEKNAPASGASLLTTKDLLSHGVLPAKRDGIYIIGKRITTTGKVQFLCQKNRAKVENMMAEKKPFKITISCNCCNCRW